MAALGSVTHLIVADESAATLFACSREMKPVSRQGAYPAQRPAYKYLVSAKFVDARPTVIPAKAGIQRVRAVPRIWIPAFARMTVGDGDDGAGRG